MHLYGFLLSQLYNGRCPSSLDTEVEIETTCLDPDILRSQLQCPGPWHQIPSLVSGPSELLSESVVSCQLGCHVKIPSTRPLKQQDSFSHGIRKPKSKVLIVLGIKSFFLALDVFDSQHAENGTGDEEEQKDGGKKEDT